MSNFKRKLNKAATDVYEGAPKGLWTGLKIFYVISEILYGLVAFNDDRKWSRKSTRWVGRKAGDRSAKRWLE